MSIGATTSITISPGNKHFIVYFSPPSESFNNIQYSIDGGNTYVSYDLPTTYGPILISNLVNGVLYELKLRCINNDIIGISSESVFSTPYTVPDYPIVNSISGDKKITINITGFNGGSQITSYQYSIDNGEYITKNENTFDITNLINGNLYVIKVKSLNIAGSSKETSVITKPFTVPSKPIILNTEPHNLKILLNFNQEDDGGSEILNYKYSINNGEYKILYPHQTKSPISINYDILSIRIQKQIKIKAVNFAGDSIESDVILAEIPCLTKGMKIQTKNGLIPIENLNDGDEIINQENKCLKIKRIFSSKIIGNEKNIPFIIPKNFFENNIPNEDIYISSNHAFFYKKWGIPYQTYGLKQDKNYINKEFIYYHIELDNYDDKIICNNLIVDSFQNINL